MRTRSRRRAQSASGHGAGDTAGLGAALDALPDAFIVLNADGTIRWANTHAARLCARTERALEGARLLEVLPPGIAQRIAQELALAPGEMRSFDLPSGSDGEFYTVHAYPTGSGTVLHLHDVTLRRQMEDTLGFLADVAAGLSGELDEGRLLSATAVLVVPCLADWCLLAVRGSAEGALRMEVAARDPADADRLLAPELLHGPESAGPHRLIALGLAATEPVVIPGDVFGPAATWPRSDSILLVPLISQGGNAGTMVMGRRADRNRFGPQEAQIADTVARRLVLAIENARSYAAAQRATTLRDDVLAVVAHDVRSPLNAIVLAASALGDETVADVELQRTAKRSILKSAERIDRLIEDLLSAARLDAGWAPAELVRVTVAELLEETADTFRRRAALQGIDLQVRVHETAQGAEAEVDADRMIEALSNIVDNALKFTQAGGSIVLSAEGAGAALMLSVADTGPGIDEALLPRLFDRFWQARRAGRTGVGLGLFITRRIVEAHGGRVWAESEQGRGSVFRILLPQRPAPETAVTRAPAQDAPS